MRRFTASLSCLAIAASIAVPSAALGASPSSYVRVKGMKTSFVAGAAPRIFVNAVDGTKKLVEADGWVVGARIRRPHDAVTSIDVDTIVSTNEWTLNPVIPSAPGDYLLRVMFYCNASFLPCGANGTMVSLTQDIPFKVTATNTDSDGKTLKFAITGQTTTAAKVKKDDGLTEAEFSTLMLKKDTGGPGIKNAKVEGDSCSLARLWIDIRAAKDALPDTSNPTNVQMYEYPYFSAMKNYGSPSQWEYWPNGKGYSPTIAYGITPGQTNVSLLEAREGSKSAWKLLTVTCKNGKLNAKLSEPNKPAKTTSSSSKSSSTSSASSSKASSISTSEWKTYDHDGGMFSLKFPKAWKAISGYDGSFEDITTISKYGMEGYGDPDHSYEIVVDSKDKSDVNTQGKTFLQYAEENMVFLSYYEPGSVTNGTKWTKYEYAARTSTTPMQYKVLFDMDDTIVVFSFLKHDALADAILASFTAK